MALKMIESFDGESTVTQLCNAVITDSVAATFNSFVGKWGGSTSTASWTLGAMPSGGTGNALKKNTDTGGQIVSRSLGLGTEVFAGFRFHHVGALVTGIIFGFRDQQTVSGAGTECGRLTLNSNGSLTLAAGSSGGVPSISTITSPVGIILANTTYYIEVRYKLSDTVGQLEIKVNGGIVAQSAIGDTKPANSTSFDRCHFGDTGGLTNFRPCFDDFYVCDTTGSVNNNYLGDVRVRLIRPDGNGNSSQFVNSAATSVNNYTYVDEQNVDDADYVESTTDGDKDTYTFGAAGVAGLVAGVQVVARSVSTNGGDPKDLNAIARLSGTEITTLVDLNGVLKQNFGIFETKPGGGAWSGTDVDNAEFGYAQVDA